MRNISFMLTQEQVKNQTKTVTRRNGWRFLKAGDLLRGVHKCQGLKAGEHPIELCVIRVESVSTEYLFEITPDELVLEGFPKMNTAEFVDMFCKSHKGVTPSTEITRIAFSYVTDKTPEIGDRVMCVGRVFATSVGDLGKVVSLDGKQRNPFLGTWEDRITVDIDHLSGAMGTAANDWKVLYP